MDKYQNKEVLSDQDKLIKPNNTIEPDLVKQIAELLIETQNSNTKQESNKKKLRGALPGDTIKYEPSRFLLEGTRYMSIFTAALHVFQMADTYDMWGHGRW